MGGIHSVVRGLAVAMIAAGMMTAVLPSAQAASQVAVVVNNVPVTTGDIAKRAAFLRLQRQKADKNTAREQMIDEVLKRGEIARLKASVSSSEVEAAVNRFASGNKMNIKQLGQVLDQAGVGLDHFRQYVAVQMSWPRAVGARYGGANGRMSPADLVKRMMENGGNKPVTTEYFLQQVIFVIPESKRKSIVGKRQAEANASRANFPGCDGAKAYAATMRDVSIRPLGRIMAQELPADWKPLIEKAGDGLTTGTRVTEKGVEYLAICKKRQVSDDLAAEIVFRAEDLGKKDSGAEDPNSQKYVEDLRKKAQIVNK